MRHVCGGSGGKGQGVYVKTQVFKTTWADGLSLWVVRYGRKHYEMTRYFPKWTDAVSYANDKAASEYRRIQMN